MPNRSGHGRSRSQQPGTKLSQSLSLSNLDLQPGQTKVITQRLVVRRRPSGSHAQGNPSNSGHRRGGTGRAHNSLPQSPRFGSGHGQRGAYPASNAVGTQHGLYLLSRMPQGSRWNQPMSNGHQHGMASLQLPVIDISAVTPRQHSLGAVSGAVGGSLGHGQNGGHGIGTSQFNQHSIHPAMNHGASNVNVANAYLTGHQDVLVIQGPNSTPVSLGKNLGHNANGLNQFNSAAGTGQSSFHHSSHKSAVISKPVQTTMEPGEDPPEVR